MATKSGTLFYSKAKRSASKKIHAYLNMANVLCDIETGLEKQAQD
jgi:hypothetical protein